MNSEIEQLLSQVIQRVQRSIRAGDCPAVAGIGGEHVTFLSDYDYLRDEQTAAKFEERAAAAVRENSARRWVIGVPQVWVIADGQVSVRAVANLPLRPGESEAITWTACDLDEGIDYGRATFGRRPGGEPVFADPEIITRQARPAPGLPGYTILQQMFDREPGE
jgi:hypothetical protein